MIKQTVSKANCLNFGLQLAFAILFFSFNSNSQIQVDTVISTYVNGSVRVDSSVVVSDSVRINDDVNIYGDLNLRGGNLNFAPNFGLALSNLSSLPNSIVFGRTGGPLTAVNPCLAPSQDPWFFFGGRIQLYDATNNLALTLGSDGVQNSIDASGNNGLLVNYYCGKNIFLGTGTGSGTGGLGTAGAKVYTGDEFLPRKNVQIGAHWRTLDANIALQIFLDGTNDGIKIWSNNNSEKLFHDGSDRFTFWGNGNVHLGQNVQVGFAPNTPIQDANTSLNVNNAGLDGIRFNTWNNVSKIIHLNNVNTPFASYSPFVVYGDGNIQMGQAVQIGQTQSGIKSLAINLNISSVNTQSAIVVNNGVKDVFRVLKNGETRIGTEIVSSRSGSLLHVSGEIDCKALYVLKPVTWSDYVFGKEYKLPSIQEEETYITKHGHLKGIPSEQEILRNGYDINEMDAKLLAKLEEAYLHIIRLEREIEELKNKK